MLSRRTESHCHPERFRSRISEYFQDNKKADQMVGFFYALIEAYLLTRS